MESCGKIHLLAAGVSQLQLQFQFSRTKSNLTIKYFQSKAGSIIYSAAFLGLKLLSNQLITTFKINTGTRNFSKKSCFRFYSFL
jgi:hypothetical protein